MKRQTNSTRFFYQSSKLVTVDQDGQLHSILRNADRPLADYHPAHGTGLLATDSKGSVLARHKQTPESGLAYTAYGHAPEVQAFGTLLGFNGERFEPVTGCYQLGNGYRAYTPVLMRFRSPDSWSPFGRGGLNAYAYCSADPINHSDPSGHVQILVEPAPAIITPKIVTPKSPKIVRSFLVHHHESRSTTTIKTEVQGEHAQSKAVTTAYTIKQTTKLYEVIAEPHKGPVTVHVTSTNLKEYLEVSDKLNAAQVAKAWNHPAIDPGPAHLNNLQNRRDGLTLWGNHLAARAADPNDLSANLHRAFRTSPGNTEVRHG
ncbi:RHS repeat-associated core domain-containing protein [Pseudomonas sp. EMN2]|uniref:RHS repeat-associated core domain-containing protein n=1 Tax=Pseudomonas sp. EMN2 TaxID=2615212 RepID=UPI00129A18AB|nr:RHS repeat-associated core domain-containing protein [Pseudomonas sp. EMN2]